MLFGREGYDRLAPSYVPSVSADWPETGIIYGPNWKSVMHNPV